MTDENPFDRKWESREQDPLERSLDDLRAEATEATSLDPTDVEDLLENIADAVELHAEEYDVEVGDEAVAWVQKYILEMAATAGRRETDDGLPESPGLPERLCDEMADPGSRQAQQNVGVPIGAGAGEGIEDLRELAGAALKRRYDNAPYRGGGGDG